MQRLAMQHVNSFAVALLLAKLFAPPKLDFRGVQRPAASWTRTHTETGVCPYIRDYIAVFAVTLQDPGVPVSKIDRVVSKLDNPPGKRTFQRHMAAIKANYDLLLA